MTSGGNNFSDFPGEPIGQISCTRYSLTFYSTSWFSGTLQYQRSGSDKHHLPERRFGKNRPICTNALRRVPAPLHPWSPFSYKCVPWEGLTTALINLALALYLNCAKLGNSFAFLRSKFGACVSRALRVLNVIFLAALAGYSRSQSRKCLERALSVHWEWSLTGQWSASDGHCLCVQSVSALQLPAGLTVSFHALMDQIIHLVNWPHQIRAAPWWVALCKLRSPSPNLNPLTLTGIDPPSY